MTWLVILIAFAAALAVFPFLRERQRIAMTPALRKKAEGQFAKLSDGLTHYSWSGGARGPVIVAVHGLTTPGIVWSAVTPILTGLGFRVLSYDLYGRGFSDAARGKQNLDFFVRQLDELLADQKVSDNITLMGYSMGGSIVTAFAAAQTHRIARVLLIAPAGIELNETPFDRFCRIVPFVGDWAHSMFGAARAGRGAAKPHAIADMQDFQLARRGYMPSVLSSRRYALNQTLEAAHRKLGREDVPVWGFWGREDGVIPLSAMGTLVRWNRAVRNSDFASADHGLTYTHADELGAAVAEMLRDPD